jgi:hypothetical protein
MEIYRTKRFNDKLRHSLSTIQLAKTRLHSLTACNSTTTVLASQIRLCDILLGEIRAIRSSLEGRMGCCGSVRRRSFVARPIRSSKRSIVPRRNLANRSRQGR